MPHTATPCRQPQLDVGAVRRLYAAAADKLAATRRALGRPLTLSEKIFALHAAGPRPAEWRRGVSSLSLRPDRLALHDTAGPMALLQLIRTGRGSVTLPTTLHCDHLVQARAGVDRDLPRALETHGEIYRFLASASARYGIGFWRPGAGIIHHVQFEQYAFPGAVLLGTDSHTPNAGGLGVLGIGVGGIEACEVITGRPWTGLHPQLVGIRLSGSLGGWATPKDVILHLCGLLTVHGGTGKVLEYFGPGAASLSATAKATICNMGAEVGATSSLFPLDDKMLDYLEATGRGEIAELAAAHRQHLTADAEATAAAERFYDQVVEVDLSRLEPQVVGPHSPDRVRPLSRLAEEVRREGWPAPIAAAMVGSCTNSSYEDMSQAAEVARQGLAAGLRVAMPLLISPGSRTILDTLRRDGLLDPLVEVGGTVLASACGPCIGQWQRDDVADGEVNSIVSSYNRNFPGRNDGSSRTLSFLASPAVVTALALGGDLTLDPLAGAVRTAAGEPLRLRAPRGHELPPDGYAARAEHCVEPPTDGSAVEIEIDPESERIQLLEPLEPWDGEDFHRLPILIKTRGKTTTDHISPAGVWLFYRAHLDRLSDNLFLGATPEGGGEPGRGTDAVSGDTGLRFAEIARRHRDRGSGSIVVGDENYGEGSSREHAALSPRHLGVRAVLARSFARIHETNLKKHGVLPLTFAEAADYERVDPADRVSVVGLAELAPGGTVEIALHKADGSEVRFAAGHSLTAEQIGWFRSGSVLNELIVSTD